LLHLPRISALPTTESACSYLSMSRIGSRESLKGNPPPTPRAGQVPQNLISHRTGPQESSPSFKRHGCLKDGEHKTAETGWASIDRNNKATLRFTAPGRASKSSAKVLSPREVKLQSASWPPTLRGGGRRRPAKVQGRSLFALDYDVRGESSPSGTDSDLEAFSHNPADGSVAALPGRTAAKTNYLKPRFLSY
jgi:hypothetical protein